MSCLLNDPLGRLLQVRNPLRESVQYTYDRLGRMTTIRDGNGNETDFAYNLRGDMTDKYWADNTHETFGYDDNGNLTEQRQAVGTADLVINLFDYDSMNRLTRERYGVDPILPSDYEYNYVYSDRGEVLTIKDGNDVAITNYGYDNLSRPTSVNHAATAGVEMSYTYDLRGNRDTMTTPTGLYDYQYDVLNRVTGVTDPGAQTTTFSYDALGRLHTLERPNNVDTTYTYDARNFLTEIAHEQGLTTLAQYTYGYDLAGNRKTLTEVSGSVTANISWEYDEANRLIEEHNDRNDIGFTTEYQYDQSGNRTREIHDSGAVIRYNYNENDQLTSIQHPNYITENYEYDLRGNLDTVTQKQGITTLGTTNYAFDARNQLTSVTSGSDVLGEFQYDYAGRRTHMDDGTLTRNYLWDEFSAYGDVVLESNVGDTTAYTLANGTLISQTVDTGTPVTSYFLSDALGSTRLMTNGSGAIANSYEYDAFGNLLGDPDLETLGTDYLYAGQQFDPLTELYSMRAQYYDASIGRFMSRDTWAYNYDNPVELNRYTYAMNNPVNFIDPSGHEALASYAKLIFTSVVIATILTSLDCSLVSCVGEDIPDIALDGLPDINGIWDNFQQLRKLWELIKALQNAGRVAWRAVEIWNTAKKIENTVTEELAEEAEADDDKDDNVHRVVVLGAGGIGTGNRYTNNAINELAPLTQLLSVKIRYPQSEIYAVDAMGGGVANYISNGLSPFATSYLSLSEREFGHTVTSSLPDDLTFDVNEVSSYYDDFASDKSDFVDVIIAFYPNGNALIPIATATNTLLKSGGEFYMVTDVSSYITTISPLLSLSISTRRTGLWTDIHATNPLGLPFFLTAQRHLSDQSDSYDLYGIKR
jgi:RHS repeat-associated protein